MENKNFTVVSGTLDDYKEVERTLIRLERVDGKTVCSTVDGENQDEIFEMLGDCLAEQLYEHPEYKSDVKDMMHVIYRELREQNGAVNWIATATIGGFCLIGIVWSISVIAQGIARLFGGM